MPNGTCEDVPELLFASKFMAPIGFQILTGKRDGEEESPQTARRAERRAKRDSFNFVLDSCEDRTTRKQKVIDVCGS